MKIGIISDTHDDIANVRRAIKIFNSEDVKYVIHAGDYIFPGVVLEFKKLNAKLIGVFGNNDGERIHLLKNFLEVGAELKGEIGEIKLDELLFGIYHGTDKNIKERLVSSQKYDVFISGHTHKIELSVARNTTNNTEQKGNTINSYQRRESTFVLNPGSAHKKVESESGAFEEGGVIIFNTNTKRYKLVKLP
ncbi:MAG TPA: metallophosphoesterase [Nitrososphaeraceae archaeon]|nr:metallophosphoesterase [Nitrososphaeraceae archaeon]